MPLRRFRSITACTIGLVRIERVQRGTGLLELVAVSVYRFHIVTTALRYTSNCFVISSLLITAVFKATIWSRADLDAILFEVMFIDERNNRRTKQ